MMLEHESGADQSPEQAANELRSAPSLPESATESHVAVADLDLVREQLGREPRGVVEVAHRCPCGNPDVVRTLPRLPDGTPFPTSFYATCPRLNAAIGTLESDGLMREMSDRIAADPDLARSYQAAHEDYLERRAQLGEVPEIAGISAGGMPERVKCLHVLVAHSLAAGPGVNPLGDEALALLAPWWRAGPCVSLDPGTSTQAAKVVAAQSHSAANESDE